MNIKQSLSLETLGQTFSLPVVLGLLRLSAKNPRWKSTDYEIPSLTSDYWPCKEKMSACET